MFCLALSLYDLRLLVRPSICLSVCPSACPSVCLSMYMSVCLPFVPLSPFLFVFFLFLGEKGVVGVIERRSFGAVSLLNRGIYTAPGFILHLAVLGALGGEYTGGAGGERVPHGSSPTEAEGLKCVLARRRGFATVGVTATTGSRTPGLPSPARAAVHYSRKHCSGCVRLEEVILSLH